MQTPERQKPRTKQKIPSPWLSPSGVKIDPESDFQQTRENAESWNQVGRILFPGASDRHIVPLDNNNKNNVVGFHDELPDASSGSNSTATISRAIGDDGSKSTKESSGMDDEKSLDEKVNLKEKTKLSPELKDIGGGESRNEINTSPSKPEPKMNGWVAETRSEALKSNLDVHNVEDGINETERDLEDGSNKHSTQPEVPIKVKTTAKKDEKIIQERVAFNRQDYEEKIFWFSYCQIEQQTVASSVALAMKECGPNLICTASSGAPVSLAVALGMNNDEMSTIRRLWLAITKELCAARVRAFRLWKQLQIGFLQHYIIRDEHRYSYWQFRMSHSYKLAIMCLMMNIFIFLCGVPFLVHRINHRSDEDLRSLRRGMIIHGSIWMVHTVLHFIYFLVYMWIPETTLKRLRIDLCGVWQGFAHLLVTVRFAIFIFDLFSQYLVSTHDQRSGRQCFGSYIMPSDGMVFVPFSVVVILIDFSQITLLSVLPFEWSTILQVSMIEACKMVIRLVTCLDYEYHEVSKNFMTGLAINSWYSLAMIGVLATFGGERLIKSSFRNVQEQQKEALDKMNMVNMLCRDTKIPIQQMVQAFRGIESVVTKSNDFPIDKYLLKIDHYSNALNKVIDGLLFVVRIDEKRYHFQAIDKIHIKSLIQQSIDLFQMMLNLPEISRKIFIELNGNSNKDSILSSKYCVQVLIYYSFMALFSLVCENDISKLSLLMLFLSKNNVNSHIQPTAASSANGNKQQSPATPSPASYSSSNTANNYSFPPSFTAWLKSLPPKFLEEPWIMIHVTTRKIDQQDLNSSAFDPKSSAKMSFSNKSCPNLLQVQISINPIFLMAFSTSSPTSPFFSGTTSPSSSDLNGSEPKLPSPQSSVSSLNDANSHAAGSGSNSNTFESADPSSTSLFHSCCLICNKIVETMPQCEWNITKSTVSFSVQYEMTTVASNVAPVTLPNVQLQSATAVNTADSSPSIPAVGNTTIRNGPSLRDAVVASSSKIADMLPNGRRLSSTKKGVDPNASHLDNANSSVEVGGRGSKTHNKRTNNHEVKEFFRGRVCVYISDARSEPLFLEIIHRLADDHNAALVRQVFPYHSQLFSLVFVQSVEACNELRSKKFTCSIVLITEKLAYIDQDVGRSAPWSLALAMQQQHSTVSSTSSSSTVNSARSSLISPFNYGIPIPCDDRHVKDFKKWLFQEFIANKGANSVQNGINNSAGVDGVVSGGSPNVVALQKSTSNTRLVNGSSEPIVNNTSAPTAKEAVVAELTNQNSITATGDITATSITGERIFEHSSNHGRSEVANKHPTVSMTERCQNVLSSVFGLGSFPNQSAHVHDTLNRTSNGKNVSDSHEIAGIQIKNVFISHLINFFSVETIPSAFVDNYIKWRYINPAKHIWHHTVTIEVTILCFLIVVICNITLGQLSQKTGVVVLCMVAFILFVKNSYYLSSVASSSSRSNLKFSVWWFGIGFLDSCFFCFSFLLDNVASPFKHPRVVKPDTALPFPEFLNAPIGEFLGREVVYIIVMTPAFLRTLAEYSPWPLGFMVACVRFLRCIIVLFRMMKPMINNNLFVFCVSFIMVVNITIIGGLVTNERLARNSFRLLHQFIMSKDFRDRLLTVTRLTITPTLLKIQDLQNDCMYKMIVACQQQDVLITTKLTDYVQGLSLNTEIIRELVFQLQVTNPQYFLRPKTEFVTRMKAALVKDEILKICSKFIPIASNENTMMMGASASSVLKMLSSIGLVDGHNTLSSSTNLSSSSSNYANIISASASNSSSSTWSSSFSYSTSLTSELSLRIHCQISPVLTMVRIDKELFHAILCHMCRVALQRIQEYAQKSPEYRSYHHEIVVWLQPLEMKKNTAVKFTDVRTMVLTVVDTGGGPNGAAVPSTPFSAPSAQTSLSAQLQRLQALQSNPSVSRPSQSSSNGTEKHTAGKHQSSHSIGDGFIQLFDLPMSYHSGQFTNNHRYHSFQQIGIPYLLCPDSYKIQQWNHDDRRHLYDMSMKSLSLEKRYRERCGGVIEELNDALYCSYYHHIKPMIPFKVQLKTAIAYLKKDQHTGGLLSNNTVNSGSSSSNGGVSKKFGGVVIYTHFNKDIAQRATKYYEMFTSLGWKSCNVLSIRHLPSNVSSFMELDCIIIDSSMNTTFDSIDLLHFVRGKGYKGVIVFAHCLELIEAMKVAGIQSQVGFGTGITSALAIAMSPPQMKGKEGKKSKGDKHKHGSSQNSDSQGKSGKGEDVPTESKQPSRSQLELVRKIFNPSPYTYAASVDWHVALPIRIDDVQHITKLSEERMIRILLNNL